MHGGETACAVAWKHEMAGCSLFLEHEAWAGPGEVSRALNTGPRSLTSFLQCWGGTTQHSHVSGDWRFSRGT